MGGLLRRLRLALFARRSSRFISFWLGLALARRNRRILQHAAVPLRPTSFTRAAEDAADVALGERILAFWDAMSTARASASPDETDAWTAIVAQQTELLDVMRRRDARAVASYLSAAPTRAICRGILQGDAETAMLRRSGPYRRQKARLTLDRFISLAEAIGALPPQNPEQGAWGLTARDLDLPRLLRAVDAHCGVEVLVPHVFGGLFVVDVAGRGFNQVDLTAIHAALRLRDLLRPASPAASILEIGAGSGRAAYWCVRFGLGPVQTVDLPHVAVVQAWYLAKALGPSAVHLYGEPVAPGAAVSIFPDGAFREVGTGVRVVFNQDSFPQMSRAAFLRYLDWTVSSDAALLLSINHEAETFYDADSRHFNASRLTEAHRGLRLLDRQRDWIRKGFVDEVYAVTRA